MGVFGKVESCVVNFVEYVVWWLMWGVLRLLCVLVAVWCCEE